MVMQVFVVVFLNIQTFISIISYFFKFSILNLYRYLYTTLYPKSHSAYGLTLHPHPGSTFEPHSPPPIATSFTTKPQYNKEYEIGS